MKLVSKYIDVCFGISGLLLMSLTIVTFVKLNTSDYTYLQGVGTNWVNGPIITVDTESLTCLEGEDNLIDDVWHGTTEGCYCPHSLDLFYGALREGACRSKRDSTLFCSDVSPVTPIKYSAWRGRQLCAKRQQGTYMDLIISQNDKSCPMDYKPCGIVDTLKNVLCFPNNLDCPMNEVKVQSSDVAIPNDKNYSVVKAGGVNFLFSNENIKGKIVNQFKISDGQPCIIPYFESIKGNLYLLDAMKSRNTCSKGVGDQVEDKSYVMIDTYNKRNLFNDNQLTNLLNTLPEFPLNNYNVPTNLYVKEYIGINPSCLNNIKQSGNSQNVMNQLNNMESDMGTTLTLSIVTMILEIISLFFVIAYVCYTFIENESSSNPKLVISCCPITFNVATFIIALVLMGNIAKYTNQFAVLNDQKCVDTVTFEALNVFESSVGSAKTTNTMVTGLSFISIVAPIVSQILLRYA
jgi:hypothetical protein